MKRALSLFTYNRPQKTLQVLTALRDQYIGPLYIFCDGAKGNRDRQAVEENIAIVEGFSLPEKEIFISKKNRGLAASILAGVSSVLERHEAVIVLEDDCLPLPGMIEFMDRQLRLWQSCPSIFSVSAHHFIRDGSLLGSYPFDVFSSQRFLCWGWATWRNRWLDVLDGLQRQGNPFGSFRAVPLEAGNDLPFHAYCYEKGHVDSWAIPVALWALKKGYHHVMPRLPLICNTGTDGSGTHCGVVRIAPPGIAADGETQFLKAFPFPKAENHMMSEAFNASMMTVPPWFVARMASDGERSISNDGY